MDEHYLQCFFCGLVKYARRGYTQAGYRIETSNQKFQQYLHIKMFQGRWVANKNDRYLRA
jgi:hypothetical protein